MADNKFSLHLDSPNHLILSSDCENINENIIKKIRTLLIAMTSNINNENFDSLIDRMIIMNVFFIEKNGNSTRETYSDTLLKKFTHSLNLLSIPNKNIRINFHVKYFKTLI